jgi:hypothetical protein
MYGIALRSIFHIDYFRNLKKRKKLIKYKKDIHMILSLVLCWHVLT